MIRRLAHLLSIAVVAATFVVINRAPAAAQTNVNKAFAAGTITGVATIEPLTGIAVPGKTLFQVQLYKNSYGTLMGRMSYTDAKFNMLSSGRVKVLSLTSSQTVLLFVVTYKTASDLLYVTLTKTVSSTGAVTNSASFKCTDYYGVVYSGFGGGNMDPSGTLIITP